MEFYSMLTAISSISSSQWAISAFQPSTVLEGIDVIRQRWWVAINTPLGSDPGRPFFGADLLSEMDKPIYLAAANISNALLNAASYVPEIKIKNIKYTFPAIGVIQFAITSLINNTPITDVLTITKTGITLAIQPKNIITDADKPVVPISIQENISFSDEFSDEFFKATSNVTISLVVDNRDAIPSVPDNGFSSYDALLVWVRANWANYGVWGQGKDALLFYLDKKYSQAQLSLAAVA